jgi:hypothetical protein
MTDMNTNRGMNNRDCGGMGTGAIAAIIAAVVIIGALLLWHPWTASNNTASNASRTTTGQSSTAPTGSGSGTATGGTGTAR